MKELFVVYCNF